MANFPWEIVLAVLGIVVPTIAALYEFVFVGRKRLGYRVQMDTTATDAADFRHAGVLSQLRREDGEPLSAPSFVLLRIENNGATHVDPGDYAVLDDDKVGIRARFPGRRVAGMVVTELSEDFLRPNFGPDSGLDVRDDVIELPKVPLNRSQHYKILAALEDSVGAAETNGRREQFEEPEIVGGIRGGVGTGGIQETKNRIGPSWQEIALICFLALVIFGQLVVYLSEDTSPLDCAKGELTLVGSTAFEPVLREATDKYKDTCSGANFTIDAQGSGDGWSKLDQAGKSNGTKSPDMLAFSDGPKSDGYPQLLPRPIAFSLFTLVINQDAGVQDLSLDQIRELYRGNITNWKDVGGNDQPVSLVSREPNSGTRTAFQKHVLDGNWEPDANSLDCKKVASNARPGIVRCQRGSTNEVISTVDNTSGAIGYTGVKAASGHENVRLVLIGGHQATLDEADSGVYPFWETEYAYTYGESPADSLAASFLRYLTNELGKDIIRSEGHRPCTELKNPALCYPS